MTKSIQVSDDDITYYTLPGGSGEFNVDGAVIDDTIFGQSFKSEDTGTKTWGVTGAAYYKGFPGYKATIKAAVGSPIAASGEATTLVSAKVYQISNAAKQIWSIASPSVTVYVGSTDHTSDVAHFDPLFGKVTFSASYSPTAAVFITTKYLDLTDLGKAQGYNLTQQANAIQTSDLPTVNSNGGYHTHQPGLRTVALTLDNVWIDTSALAGYVTGNTTLVIEINPDGASKSRARGFFRALNDKLSGNVGALELESLGMSLNVPNPTGDSREPQYPFRWDHALTTTLAPATRVCLDAWENETLIYVKYLSDGTNGHKGQAVVTDVSLAGALESMNQFQATFMGSGALTAVP